MSIEVTERPTVTFALWAYNQERFIRRAVEGAFAQTYSPLEILLSDDCSTDRTFDIMREMVASYRGPHQVRLNRTPHNLGIGGHISSTIDSTKGRLVIFAAGDDVSHPHRTYAVVQRWRERGMQVAAITSSVRVVDSTGHVVGHLSCRRMAARYGGTLGLFGPSYALARQCFNGFAPLNGIQAEDQVFGFRALLLEGVATIDAPLVDYRVHGDSASMRFRGPLSYLEQVNQTIASAERQLATLELQANDAGRFAHFDAKCFEVQRWICHFKTESLRINGWLRLLRLQRDILALPLHRHACAVCGAGLSGFRLDATKWLLKRFLWFAVRPRMRSAFDLPGLDEPPEGECNDYYDLPAATRLNFDVMRHAGQESPVGGCIKQFLRVTGWFTRSFPHCRGRWRLIAFIMRRDHWLNSLGWQQIEVPAVGKMKVLPSEFLGKYLFLYGRYEDKIAQLFTLSLRPGDVAIDVGANIGYFTLLAARLCGPQGRVDAFEASPEVFEILAENVRANCLTNVVLHPCAAGSENGETRFQLADKNQMGLGSMRVANAPESRLKTVPLKRLDDVLPTLPRIRLLKVDVEGAEPLVLKGARQLLERDQPFVVMELTDEYSRQLGTSAAEAVALMHELGYSMYNIDENCEEIESAPAHQVNMLCIPSGSQRILADLRIG